jgi:hypothetical protein
MVVASDGRSGAATLRSSSNARVASHTLGRLLDQTNAAFAALQSNESAWQDELAERQDWDATLADGLDDA